LENCAVFSAAATWWGLKLTAMRPRQIPFAILAASGHALPERFVRLNAAKRHSLIFIIRFK
jgi:hypothetical protein